MKQLFSLIAALCCIAIAQAQQTGRIQRTEISPYVTRQEADTRKNNDKGVPLRIDYKPTAVGMTEGGVVVGQTLEIPYAWTDGNTYLHLENIGSAYTLGINGRELARIEDSSTPTDFYISPLIGEGSHTITLEMRRSPLDELNATPASREAFANCYLYNQNKRNIADFTMTLAPDSTQKFGILKIDVIAQNSFNYPEPVTVGYDVYSPQGKLMEFNITEITIPGRSTDTVHFAPYIYHTYQNKWEAGGKLNPPLYKVMLFTRRDGAYKEYIPLKTGFKDVEFRDGKFYSFGKELKLSEAVYNAAADAKITRAELLKIKAQGKNTIRPDYPQPAWFYGLCDELGLWVIDRANIHASERSNDRKIGGTPANDPALAGEFIERVKAMYYRSRNFTCVIAYSLGGETGNGYNMYKAYQWLKSVETERPVIYEDADGEWNSDL